MRVRTEQVSAAAGETSPLLNARSDLTKWQTGAQRIMNMIVLPEGPRARRSGTRFVAALKDESRPAALAAFDRGDGDTFVLAFNAGSLRIYRDAATLTAAGVPVEAAVPFGDADLAKLRWAQSLDTMFFAWGGAPQRITRQSNSSWIVEPYPFARGPVKLRNIDKSKTIQASATTGAITLTASVSLFTPGHVGSIWRLDETNVGDIAVWRLGIAMTVGAKVRWQGRIYEVITAGDSGDFAPQHDEGDVQAGASSSTAGAVFRFLCNDHGYVRITAVASGTSASADVLELLPPAVVSNPTYRWAEGAWCDANGWPDVVAIVDQSLLWGKDNVVWLSETTDIYAFEESTADDSAVSFRLFSPDGKSVRFRWAMNAGSLLLGATSGEWVVRGPTTYDRITSQNSRGFLQASEGSAAHQPVSVAGGAVFIGRARDRLNLAKFDFVSERISIDEFTTFSRHMLKKKAVQLAWQADPHRICWVLLADGTLAAVTLRPDQEVAGWHRHTLPGAFIEQIACIQSSDASTTELWLQTRRTINGQTRRYIEVMQPYFTASDEDNPDATGAWFVDCGIVYSGPATATINGLAHLEGQQVLVSTPRGDIGRFTVAGGAVTLPQAVTYAVVGIPFAFETTSLPLDVQTQEGPSKGRIKSLPGAGLHVYQSGPCFVSVNGGLKEPMFFNAAEQFDAYRLTNGVDWAPIGQISEREIRVTVSGDHGLPFTLLDVVSELDVKR